MSKQIILMLLCFSSYAFASEGEAKALDRLSMTTDMLIVIGDEMSGDPFSGMLLMGDTVSIDLSVDPEYSYQFIIWTDSAFNNVDFWLTNPLGENPIGDFSDHTTMAIIPDSLEAGIWQLEMELIEGAYSDTAYYAAAVFRRARSSQ